MSGPGYDDKQKALESYTVMSNLKMRLITYDRDKIKDVVYDGQYMLGVSESDVQLTQYQIDKYVIDVLPMFLRDGKLPSLLMAIGLNLMVVGIPVPMSLQRQVERMAIPVLHCVYPIGIME